MQNRLLQYEIIAKYSRYLGVCISDYWMNLAHVTFQQHISHVFLDQICHLFATPRIEILISSRVNVAYTFEIPFPRQLL